jgi:GntR family transcriptional regulator
MNVRIDPSDGVPIYLQITNQVKRLVASGRLARGDELPPIRVLAERLIINPNTVARAYLELERAGIVTKRHGTGTYVSSEPAEIGARERLRILTQRADALLVDAAHLGTTMDEVIDLIHARAALVLKEVAK